MTPYLASFVLDVPILLPLVGLLVEILSRILSSKSALTLSSALLLLMLSAGIVAGDPIFFAVGTGAILAIFTICAIYNDKSRARPYLYIAAAAIFLAISGSLYLDYLNLSFLARFIGHHEIWSGNHFMWNSGAEVVGLKPFVAGAPTYKNFWSFWNLFALVLFASYPAIMILAGKKLHGILFGYTNKQTGVSALFFERKKC